MRSANVLGKLTVSLVVTLATGLAYGKGREPSDVRALVPTSAPGETEDDVLPPLPPPFAPPAVLPGGASAPSEPAAVLPSQAMVASKYAALDRSSCEAELQRRHVAFDRVSDARGVLAPVRLAGPLAGAVQFHSMLPPAQRKTSPYEIYDCRLVLALDDFAKILARHDVVEVVHFSVYRPPPAKVALRGQGRRHSGALAIDAAIFKTRDGRTLSVEKDFHGRIGGKPCPTAATAPELQKIACEAADAQLFNVVLTPDFNWAHRNHFHLEVTSGVRWSFVR